MCLTGRVADETQQLLENETLSSAIPLGRSVDASISTCVVVIIIRQTEWLQTAEVYHVSFVNPQQAAALWNSASTQECKVWLIGGNIMDDSWIPSGQYNIDTPRRHQHQLEEFSDADSQLVSSSGNEYAVLARGRFAGKFFRNLGAISAPNARRNLGAIWGSVAKKSGMEMKLGEKRQEVKISAISPEFRRFFAV